MEVWGKSGVWQLGPYLIKIILFRNPSKKKSAIRNCLNGLDTRWHRLLRTKRLTAEPKLKAALCHNAYDKIGLHMPINAKERPKLKLLPGQDLYPASLAGA